MTENAGSSEALKRSTASMRRSRQKELGAGYRRASVALSPASLDVVEQIKTNFGLPSRDAAINAVLELISANMFLWHEFMSHRPSSPTPDRSADVDRNGG